MNDIWRNRRVGKGVTRSRGSHGHRVERIPHLLRVEENSFFFLGDVHRVNLSPPYIGDLRGGTE